MNISPNQVIIFCRKSSDVQNLSIASQETTINEFLKNNNVNTDNVSIKMTLVGSAYNNKNTHKKLLPFVSSKNKYICISDITRLSRNLKYFEEILLPIFKKHKTKICIANTKQILDVTNDVNLLDLKSKIMDAEKESQLKSNISKVNYSRFLTLKKSKNKNLTIDKIYNLKTGNIITLPVGYYRSPSGNKCKIPINKMMAKNKLALIPISKNNKLDNNNDKDKEKLSSSNKKICYKSSNQICTKTPTNNRNNKENIYHSGDEINTEYCDTESDTESDTENNDDKNTESGSESDTESDDEKTSNNKKRKHITHKKTSLSKKDIEKFMEDMDNMKKMLSNLNIKKINKKK